MKIMFLTLIASGAVVCLLLDQFMHNRDAVYQCSVSFDTKCRLVAVPFHVKPEALRVLSAKKPKNAEIKQGYPYHE